MFQLAKFVENPVENRLPCETGTRAATDVVEVVIVTKSSPKVKYIHQRLQEGTFLLSTFFHLVVIEGNLKLR